MPSSRCVLYFSVKLERVDVVFNVSGTTVHSLMHEYTKYVFALSFLGCGKTYLYWLCKFSVKNSAIVSG